jgi:hypothetical protein
LFRQAHNKLRVLRGLPPIPEPEVDLYVLTAPAAPRASDHRFEALAALLEFRGKGDQTRDWKGIALKLAEMLVDEQFSSQKRLHAKERHRAIARFFVLAQKESGWSRDEIIAEAAKQYGVEVRTVETALAKWQERETLIYNSKNHPR